MPTASGYAEMFEWEDGNPNREDRAGQTVVLVGDKISIARPGETPIGVIGGDNTSTAAISNASPDEWHGRHVRDAANRFCWEEQTMVEWVEQGYRHWYEADRLPEGVVPPENAEYISTDPRTGTHLMRQILSDEYKAKWNSVPYYLPRWERPEWGIVVLLGRTVVRASAPKNSNWTKLKSLPGQLGDDNVEEWLVR